MPGGNTGRSVIGLTDIDGIGTAGLERQYNALLQGNPGEKTLEVAPGGHGDRRDRARAAAGDSWDRPGHDDRPFGAVPGRAGARPPGGVTGAVGGQIIVMDTDTGDVIAMVSVDRNEQGVPVVSSGNFAAVGAYEPGSVGKVITLAGALEEGAVTPDTMFGYVPWEYDCTTDVGGVLHDSHPHDPWSLTTAGILVESSNVGTILVSKTIGYERLDHYMRAFGLGERTALDFPDESPGILKPWNDWTGTERCTVAYGQGVSSTPIQLASAVNVVANDGVYVAPRLVSATVGPTASSTEPQPSATRQVRQRADSDADAVDDARRRVQRHGRVGAGRRVVDRRQDWNGLQGTGGRYLFQRRRDHPRLLLQLRRVLPGRGPAGHGARSRSTSRQTGFNSGAQSAAPDVPHARADDHPRAGDRPAARFHRLRWTLSAAMTADAPDPDGGPTLSRVGACTACRGRRRR